MHRVGNFVGSTIKSLKAEQAVKLHELKSAWLKAVGLFLGTQTEPVRIKGNTLFLVVSSSMWSQEISLQQRSILNKLKSHLKSFPPPKKIVCFVGEPHEKKQAQSDTGELHPDETLPWKEHAIPEERQKRIEQSLSSVQDDRIREKLKKLMQLAVRRELYLVEQGQLPCPYCGKFRPAEQDLCKYCHREKIEEQERTAMRVLAQKPWLSAQDLAERTALPDRNTFLRVRKKLLGNWMLQAWQGTSGLKGEQLRPVMTPDFRELLMDITMLRCSLPAHSLKPRHFYFALGKRLAQGYLDEPEDYSSTEDSH